MNNNNNNKLFWEAKKKLFLHPVISWQKLKSLPLDKMLVILPLKHLQDSFSCDCWFVRTFPIVLSEVKTGTEQKIYRSWPGNDK